MKALVAGAGGFIGGHLVRALLADGVDVRALDHQDMAAWQQLHLDAENLVGDLSTPEACVRAVTGCDHVYHLAADMGGVGFIERNRALCMLSTLIDIHLLVAARDQGVERFFFASSACVYPTGRQDLPGAGALREEDAYPADPEDGYGWAKLTGERLCRHFTEDFGLETRVARYHNVYGPWGTWTGGREKAPAAVCRKVALARMTGRPEIEVWGDGTQTRTFTYIDDCIEGTRRLMASEVREPLNVGSSELVTINELIDRVCEIAGVQLARRHDLSAPQGVRGRNSDNRKISSLLGWAPSTPLGDGLAPTFEWIVDQLKSA